ncbi:hypothetical protein QYF36_015535 [Acer negundo]|nr:hypothetical protein QYF36_015535 [Acer negundo]
MDPAHVPCAHYGVIEIDQQPKVRVDREGGKPLDFVVEQLDINGFFGKHLWDSARFVAPCTYYNYNHPSAFKSNGYVPPAAGTDHNTRNLPEQRQMVFFFFCIPVSPGGKILDVGPANWHKACFVPTKSDAFVVCFRKWLNRTKVVEQVF